MSDMKIKENLFLKEYVNQMTDVILQTNPNLDKKDVKDIVKETVKERLMDPVVTMDNNYRHEQRDAHLTSVLNWAMENKPVIAGNGTFYKQHKQAINPTSIMVDGFLDDRKKLKKQMFAVGDEESHEYKDFDLKQQNKKKLANSYYGASGAPTSAFYSKWSGPATTKSAQSVISTTETMFESFLTGNFIFIDFNECFMWIKVVLDEEWEIDDWIVPSTLDECFEYLSNRILDVDDYKKEILYNYLSNLTQDDWTHLFYKNNLIEFTRRHEKVMNLHRKVFESINVNHYQEIPVDRKGNLINDDDINLIPGSKRDEFINKEKPGQAWNKYVSIESFYDPNAVPDSVSDTLKEISEISMKYVYVKYLCLDKIYRLKNFNRDVVTVIDTDSNILSLDTWMSFVQNEIMESDYNREYMDNIYIAINSITYLISDVVNDILLYYGECSNVDEEYRPRYNMKNEFFFGKLVIAKTKKRYLSKILLREGNRLLKPKYDVKGFD